MKCYYCRNEVSEEEHHSVQRTELMLLGEPCDSDLHIAIAEDSFVHMTPAPDEVDEAGDPVVCAYDWVLEVSMHWHRASADLHKSFPTL